MKKELSLSQVSWVVAAALALVGGLMPNRSQAADARNGIALAIVYDTSGSMLERVRDGAGTLSPKYQIANRALDTILKRLHAIATGSKSAPPRRLDCGLVVFNQDRASMAVHYGAFNAAAMQSWLAAFKQPQGSTPLGDAVRVAGKAVLASPFSRKHVLILTDGMNTRGADPAVVIPALNQEAKNRGASVSYHFVAFDVDAKVFDRVKKLGATVVGAADEKQLNAQLQFILEEKILLEDEEPPSAKTKNP